MVAAGDRRIDDLGFDRRRPQQSLGRRQRRGEVGPPARRQGGEEPTGGVLGASIEALPFPPPGLGEHGAALAAVGRVSDDADEALLLELAQQPAEVARVQPEASPQLADAGSAAADLEQQTRRPERSTGVEVRLLEHSDALGEGPVEPAQRGQLLHDR